MDYKTARGWLRDDEREELRKQAARIGDAIIINIGIEYGASLVCLRSGSDLSKIIAIDIDVTKLDPEVYKFAQPLLVDKDSCSHEAKKVVEDLVVWLKNPVKLLFVDGDHSYNGVKCDTWYCDIVGIGGVVVFHDCYDYLKPETLTPNVICPDINRAVDEWSSLNVNWKDLGRAGTMRLFRRVS